MHNLTSLLINTMIMSCFAHTCTVHELAQTGKFARHIKKNFQILELFWFLDHLILINVITDWQLANCHISHHLYVLFWKKITWVMILELKVKSYDCSSVYNTHIIQTGHVHECTNAHMYTWWETDKTTEIALVTAWHTFNWSLVNIMHASTHNAYTDRQTDKWSYILPASSNHLS